jgi:hypothetical protein
VLCSSALPGCSRAFRAGSACLRGAEAADHALLGGLSTAGGGWGGGHGRRLEEQVGAGGVVGSELDH